MKPYGIDEELTKFGKTPDFLGGPSKKFIRKVERNLPFDSNDISLALKLYNNLNDCVVYDEEFMMFNQDVSIEFINDIYNRGIEQINLSDNTITCNNWASLYCYFLNKNGITAVVNSTTIHKYVVFKANGFLFKADATSTLKDNDKKFNMTDLTRRRLGLKPAGLRAFISDDDGVSYVNVYDLGLELDSTVNDMYLNFDNRTSMLLSKLKSDTNFRSYSFKESDEVILDKFSLISDLVSKEQLDTVSGISYINNLIKIILSDDEQKHLSFDYLKSVVDGNYKCIELINYNVDYEFTHKHDYHFHPSLEGYNFVYRGNGLEYISRKKARKLIEESDNIDLSINDNSSLRRK